MRYIDFEGKIYVFFYGFEDIIMNFIDIEKVNRKRNRRVWWNDYYFIALNDIIDNFSSRYDMQVIYHIITEMNYYFFLDWLIYYWLFQQWYDQNMN